MDRELEGRDSRILRVHTAHGTVEGRVCTNPGVSTLHFLNVVSSSQNFFTLREPVRCSPGWSFEDGPVSVATSSVLFVVELSEFEPRPGDPEAAAQFKRAPVRLHVANHTIEGFVHVPPGGDPIIRLNQDRHPFVALTSASVLGPDSESAAPFLAVNRSFILAMQAIPQEETADATLAAEIGAET